MNSVQKICFLWSLMSVFANLSMEYEASVLFESTQIKEIKKRRQIIKDQLQKIPAVQKTRIQNYCYYVCLGALACAGAIIFAQNMNINPTRISLFESGIGGITLLLSTAAIDILHRRFSDNIEALVDYKIINNDIFYSSDKSNKVLEDKEKELKALIKKDLDTIYANYHAFHKNYFLPQTRFANWILKKFDLGRTKKHTRLQRRYITDKCFPLYEKRLAQYFGKNEIKEIFNMKDI